MASDLVLKECPTCYEAVPLHRVLFLQCGHKICNVCINQCESKCAVCRTPIVKGTPHRIYLTMDEIVSNKSVQLIEGLNNIDANTPATSVERTSRKMQQWVEKMERESDIAKSILEASKAMKERLIPRLKEYEEMCHLNRTVSEDKRRLEEQVQGLKDQLRRQASFSMRELEEKERITERYRAAYNKKKAEVRELQDAKEAGERKIKLLNTKIRALGTKEKSGRRRNSGGAADASLQVEAEDKTEEAKPKKYKRPHENTLTDLDLEPQIRNTKQRRDS